MIIITGVIPVCDILCVSNVFQASISPGICLTDNGKLNFLGCVVLAGCCVATLFYSLYREVWQAAALPPCENLPAHSVFRPFQLGVTLNQVSK